MILQFSNNPYRMMLRFQNWDFLCIKDIDLHNLTVKKESSLLPMPLKYFYQITYKAIYMSYHYYN
jgi:hypothetical protein